MKAKQVLKTIAIGITIIVALGLFVMWTNAHDAAEDAAMTKYDNCVQDHFGMSAASYYQTNGTLPECK